MKKLDLETPSLLVHHQKMLRNIKAMQQVANSAGVGLRPHTKTHKCPELAQLQLKEGASGICVQKLGEAEVMVESGIRDIFITNEIVDPTKIRRLARLQAESTVRVCIDSLDNAAAIGKEAALNGQVVPVILDVDSGMKRTGVSFGPQLSNLAHRVSRIEGVRFDGMMTFEGHLYHISDKKRRDKVAKRLIGRFVETVKRIRKSGIEVAVVSCGSTPTAAAVAQVEGVTEIQPGNYVFCDLMQVELGSATIENCAQRVLASVISVPTSTRFVVDAGSKAFSHDQGRYPRTLDIPNAKGSQIHEEHLTMRISSSKLKPRVGDKLEFIPYHACTATNMYDQMHITDGDEVSAIWPISARGKML